MVVSYKGLYAIYSNGFINVFNINNFILSSYRNTSHSKDTTPLLNAIKKYINHCNKAYSTLFNTKISYNSAPSTPLLWKSSTKTYKCRFQKVYC